MREYKARRANGCQRARTAEGLSSTPLYATPPGRKGHTHSVPLQLSPSLVFLSHRILRRSEADAPRCAWRCLESSGAFNTKRFAITND